MAVQNFNRSSETGPNEFEKYIAMVIAGFEEQGTMAESNPSKQDEVRSEIEIAAPIERVFQALTDPQQLLRWWTSQECHAELWEMDARVGARWRARLRSDSISINGSKAFEPFGRIVEMDPPRLLAYTWNSNWDPPPPTETLVRWELSSTASGTSVRLTHSRLTPQLAKDYSGGWPGVVEKLKQYVEGSGR